MVHVSTIYMLVCPGIYCYIAFVCLVGDFFYFVPMVNHH